MTQTLFQGELFADYHQIYLRDSAHPNLPDDYARENLARRLMVGPTAVILHTARNMTVPLRLEWHPRPPAPDLDSWQHVVEAGFDCPSGWLILAGMTDGEATPPITVPAGRLGLRASMTGLDTLSEDGLDGDDRYVIQLWHASGPVALRVLKAWPLA